MQESLYEVWFSWNPKTQTRMVLGFATEHKKNVDPSLRSRKKVNYIQLFFAFMIFEFSYLDGIVL